MPEGPREELSIEYRGRVYTGSRIVRGKAMLFQEIHYRLRVKSDGHQYRPSEDQTMRAIAKIILRELVEEDLREAADAG